MSALFINPALFFLIEENGVIAWDYKHHHQYLLSKEDFMELLHVAQHGKTSNGAIAQELKQANLVVTEKSERCDWGWDMLAKIFHVGTQNVHADQTAFEATWGPVIQTTDNPSDKRASVLAANYIAESTQLAAKARPSLFVKKRGKCIKLPTPDITKLEKISFYSVIKNRKTNRNFNGLPISLDELSSLLFASFGLVHGASWPDFESANLTTVGYRKASPASGALHAEEIYVCAFRVTDLKPGIYHYQPNGHTLTLLSLGNHEEEIIAANYNQFFARGLACGFYVTCRLDKLWWKYKHSRSFKVALLDIGHVSQTFLLSATALALNTWLTASFQDKMVNDIIQVDGTLESALLFLGVGHGSNQSIPAEILQLTH